MATTPRAAKTAWFPPHIKPVRVGVYETRGGFAGPWVKFQRWTGRYWCCYAPNAHAASKERLQSGLRMYPQWRGLTKEAV